MDGRLYIVGENPNFQSRARTVQLQLLRLQQRYHLPDVDFVLTTADSCLPVDGPVRSHDGNQTRCQRAVGRSAGHPFALGCKHKVHGCLSAGRKGGGGGVKAYVQPLFPANCC